MSDVKLPDTMYRMAPIYGTKSFGSTVSSKQTGGDQRESIGQSLDEQTERLNNLNLSNQELIDVVLQLPVTSPLLTFLTSLKAELKNRLNVRLYKHSSLANQTDDRLIKQWYSLTSSTPSDSANYNLQVILKPSDFTGACLFKSDSNFKLIGEIKILALLNGLIGSSMSVRVNDLNDLVHKLLLDEYLDYLQQSINTKATDPNRIEYYQNNLPIKSKVQELAELIYKNQF